MTKNALIFLVMLFPMALHAEETGALVKKFTGQTITPKEQKVLADRVATCAAATKAMALFTSHSKKEFQHSSMLQASHEYFALGMFLTRTSKNSKSDYRNTASKTFKQYLKLAKSAKSSDTDKKKLHDQLESALDVCKATEGMRATFVTELHKHTPKSPPPSSQ